MEGREAQVGRSPRLKVARALNKVDCTDSNGYSSDRWVGGRVEFGRTDGGNGQTRQIDRDEHKKTVKTRQGDVTAE